MTAHSPRPYYTSARIDMSLALSGYLRSPSGKLRYIRGLDTIMADAVSAQAHLLWYASGHIACCDWRRRVILLDPWLWRHKVWVVRLVVSHELGHCVVGPNDARVRLWQEQRYGDLIHPLQ